MKKQSSQVNKTEDGIVLCQRGDKQKKDVYLTINDRLHHEYFVGQDDTGKSTIILNQVLEDIKAGNGFCFIDQYGDYVDKILSYFPKERIDDLIYIDFSDTEYPIGINILNEAKTSEEIDMIINNIINMFVDMYGPELFGPRIQDYVYNACLVLMENNLYYGDEGKYTFFDIIKMITSDLSAFTFHNIQNPIANYRWNHTYRTMGDREKGEIIPFIQAKLSPLFTGSYARNIFLQPESSVDLNEAVKENKVIICNLSRGTIGNINSEILGRILMLEINIALSRRDKMKKSNIKPYFLYLDGFQDYVGSSFGDFLSNTTRCKIGVTMFNQYASQLKKQGIAGSPDFSQYIFNLVGTIGTFRVGVLDVEILDKIFSSKFEKFDLQQLKNNELIIKKYEENSYIKPFLGYVKKYDENVINSQKKLKLMKEISELKRGTKREIIDKEIHFRTGF